MVKNCVELKEMVCGIVKSIVFDLKNQGHSDEFIDNRVLSKIENIITYSAEFGKVVQKEIDKKYLIECNTKIERLKKELKKNDKNNRKVLY